jgi:hypothetical protein
MLLSGLFPFGQLIYFKGDPIDLLAVGWHGEERESRSSREGRG